MDFIKQNATLNLMEAGGMFLVLVVAIILQIIISRQQFLRAYRFIGIMANMFFSLVLSIWFSFVTLTFFEEIVQNVGFYLFYTERILPFLIGGWVVYLTAIICTHFITTAVMEHKIYQKSQQGKELDQYKNEFTKKPDFK